MTEEEEINSVILEMTGATTMTEDKTIEMIVRNNKGRKDHHSNDLLFKKQHRPISLMIKNNQKY